MFSVPVRIQLLNYKTKVIFWSFPSSWYLAKEQISIDWDTCQPQKSTRVLLVCIRIFNLVKFNLSQSVGRACGEEKRSLHILHFGLGCTRRGNKLKRLLSPITFLSSREEKSLASGPLKVSSGKRRENGGRGGKIWKL